VANFRSGIPPFINESKVNFFVVNNLKCLQLLQLQLLVATWVIQQTDAEVRLGLAHVYLHNNPLLAQHFFLG
jgi:hypothetical protein